MPFDILLKFPEELIKLLVEFDIFDEFVNSIVSLEPIIISVDPFIT